jgi:hypothetical protein
MEVRHVGSVLLVQTRKKIADYFRHDRPFENPLRVGFAILLRIVVAGLFFADVVASCSGVAARFFPHGLRPRR